MPTMAVWQTPTTSLWGGGKRPPSTLPWVNSTPNQSVYMAAATVSRSDNRRSSDADFVQAPGVWLDQDKPEHTAIDPILRPGFYIITGRHPHLRRQLFYPTTLPLTDPNTVRNLNIRLQRSLGGDAAVQNPTSLMRLPGSIAWPHKAGRIPEMTGWYTDEGSIRRYPLAQLEAELPKPDEKKAEKPSSTLNVRETLADLRRPHEWHPSVRDLVMHLVALRLTDDLILEFAAEWTMPGYTVEKTREEIQVFINGARNRIRHHRQAVRPLARRGEGRRGSLPAGWGNPT